MVESCCTIALRFKCYKHVSLNPNLMFFFVNDCFKAWSTHSAKLILCSSMWLFWNIGASSTFLNVVLNDLKQDKFDGCKTCDVWDVKVIMSNPNFCVCFIASKVTWLFLRVYLWIIACRLMWQTKLHGLEYIGVVLWKKSNAPLNQTLPLKKSFAFFLKLSSNTPIIKCSLDEFFFHLICFQLYMWKCVVFLSSQNIFKYNDDYYFFNTSFLPCT